MKTKPFILTEPREHFNGVMRFRLYAMDDHLYQIAEDHEGVILDHDFRIIDEGIEYRTNPCYDPIEVWVTLHDALTDAVRFQQTWGDTLEDIT